MVYVRSRFNLQNMRYDIIIIDLFKQIYPNCIEEEEIIACFADSFLYC